MAAHTVLHVIETGGPGGAERMMVHLAAGLGPEYHSEAALIRDSWLGTALRNRGIPVTMLSYGTHSRFPRLGDLATLRDLVTLIRKKRVGILHTHEFFMNTVGLAASWLTGIPLVATVHGRNYYSDRLRRRAAYRLVARFSGQMVAVSDYVRSFLAERVGIPSDRIQVVQNGVPEHEGRLQERTSALRNDLGIGELTKVVGTVGSLYPVKGHTYLIDAAVHVARRYPDVVFLIAGRGRLREELETQARRLGVGSCIRFLGHRDDVYNLLDLFDVFVLPSLSEGMPLALLEAMAAGVPPIATSVGGVNEVLEDGKTGMLVPPRESYALAEGIIALFEGRTVAKEMGEAARKVVTSRFSLARMLQVYQQIYADLIRKRNGRVQE